MMGYDDRKRQDRSTGLAVVLAVGLAILAALLFGFARQGHAQAGQPSDCSGTATSAAATITYPTSGATGSTSPSQFVTISNPSATATLWVCAAKGCTAAANTAGSVALGPVGGVGVNGISWWRPGFPLPQAISILSSAASSPFTCNYQ